MGDNSDIGWQTYTFSEDSNLFFLRRKRQGNLYKIEMVLNGTEEDCKKYKVEISINNGQTGEPAFKSIYTPRPISMEKWGKFYLGVPEEVMANVWQHDVEGMKFKIYIHVGITKNLGQGRGLSRDHLYQHSQLCFFRGFYPITRGQFVG